MSLHSYSNINFAFAFIYFDDCMHLYFKCSYIYFQCSYLLFSMKVFISSMQLFIIFYTFIYIFNAFIYIFNIFMYISMQIESSYLMPVHVFPSVGHGGHQNGMCLQCVIALAFLASYGRYHGLRCPVY